MKPFATSATSPAPGMRPVHRIIPDVRKPILAVSDRVSGNESRVCRCVVSNPIIAQSGYCIVRLTGVAGFQPIR